MRRPAAIQEAYELIREYPITPGDSMEWDGIKCILRLSSTHLMVENKVGMKTTDAQLLSLFRWAEAKTCYLFCFTGEWKAAQRPESGLG